MAFHRLHALVCVGGEIEDSQEAILASCHKLIFLHRVPTDPKHLVRVRVFLNNYKLLAGGVVTDFNYERSIRRA